MLGQMKGKKNIIAKTNLRNQRTWLRMASLSDFKRQQFSIFQIQASMNREDVPLAATSDNYTQGNTPG